MNVKFKDGGKVSITDMPMALFDAIQKIVWCTQRSLEWDEDCEEWQSNGSFVCCLDQEEKEALDNINWTL